MKPENRIWIWVILAFACLLTAWGFFFKMAAHHKVQEVPLHHTPP